MNLYSCMIWLRGPPSLSSNNNLEVAGKKSGISTAASQKRLSERGRVSRQYDFSLTCQDRDTKELLKEIKVKVNSKVCFTITLLDEFYGDFSLYGRKKKKNLTLFESQKGRMEFISHTTCAGFLNTWMWSSSRQKLGLNTACTTLRAAESDLY